MSDIQMDIDYSIDDDEDFICLYMINQRIHINDLFDHILLRILASAIYSRQFEDKNIHHWDSNDEQRTNQQLVCRKWNRLTKHMCYTLSLNSCNIRYYVISFPINYKSVTSLEIIGSNTDYLSKWTSKLLSVISYQDSMLTTLNLTDLEISSDHLLDIVEALLNNESRPKIEKIILDSNPLENDGIVQLCRLLKHTDTIKELSLQSNESEDGLDLLSDIISTTNTLKYLDFSYNKTDYNGIISLSNGLRVNETVEVLLLVHCEIDGSGAYSLGDTIGRNQTIKKIDISDNSFGDGSMTNLAKNLSLNHSLTHLNLSGNNFTCNSFNALFTSIYNHPTLKYLNLSRNNISSLDLMNLSVVLGENNVLETLIMNECNLSNHHMDLISMALIKNKSIKYLDLSRNNINNIQSIIEILLNNSTLQQFVLSKNLFDYNSLITLLHFILKVPLGLNQQHNVSFAQQMGVLNSVHKLNFINISPKTMLPSKSYTQINQLIKNANHKLTIVYT